MIHDVLCEAKNMPCWCRLPLGHHGRHECRPPGCGTTWANENETRPCPSTATTVLGAVGSPALLRCGLLFDHDGPHRFAVTWEAGEEVNEEQGERCESCGEKIEEGYVVHTDDGHTYCEDCYAP